MRTLLSLLAGLFIGALVAFSAANALSQRNAWQRGVMHVLQHHLDELRRQQRRGNCAAADSALRFRRLAETAADIGPSRPDEKPDYHDQARRFIELGTRLGAEPPADCRALDAAMQQIGNACKDCHRDYR